MLQIIIYAFTETFPFQERKFVDGAQSLPDKMAADLGIGGRFSFH